MSRRYGKSKTKSILLMFNHSLTLHPLASYHFSSVQLHFSWLHHHQHHSPHPLNSIYSLFSSRHVTHHGSFISDRIALLFTPCHTAHTDRLTIVHTISQSNRCQPQWPSSEPVDLILILQPHTLRTTYSQHSCSWRGQSWSKARYLYEFFGNVCVHNIWKCRVGQS